MGAAKAALIITVVLAISSDAGAQFAPQQWQANQDANGFTCTSVSQLGVGSVLPPATKTAAIIQPQNGDTSLFICNSDGADSGSESSIVLQAATNCTPGTTTSLGTAVYGQGWTTPLISPFFTAGSAVLGSYFGSQNFVIDMGTPNGVKPRLIITSRPIASNSQVILGEFDYDGNFYVPQTLGGAGTQCLGADNSGRVFGTGTPCGAGAGGSGGGGTVDTVTGTPPIFITSTPTVTPNVTIQGSIISGSTSTSGQNIGGLVSGVMEEVTSGGVATIGTYAAGASRIPFGTGSNGALTDSANLGWNGTVFAAGMPPGSAPSGSQAVFYQSSTTTADFDVINDNNSAAFSQAALRVCSDTSCTNSLLFAHLNHGWSVLSPVLGPGNALFELEDGTSGANFAVSNFGNGDIVFSTGGSRVTRWQIKNAGQLQSLTMTAPGTPASGQAAVWVDSTSKNLAVKNDAGTVNHGAQTFTCSAHQFSTALSDAGASTCTQPAFSDVSGSVTCAQLPALTGDVTTSAGSCATTLNNIPNATTMAGDVVVTEIAAPGTPAAGKLACYGDSTSLNWACKDELGNVKHGAQSTAATAGSCLSALSDTGQFSKVTVASQVTKRDYTFDVSGSGLNNNTWMISGGGLLPGAALQPVEYPNGFIAGHIQVTANLALNGISAGSLSFAASMNGSGLGGTGFTYTSGSSTGLTVGSTVATGSASSSDVFGFFFSTTNTYVSTQTIVTFQVVLTP